MIRLENVSKYYYSANSVVPALRKINLEFNIGEFVAITGESGSGKSTLLNIISGMDTYDDGELFIDGEETSFYDDADWEDYRRNKIGFVFQNYNLIDNYSSLYNVESSLLIQGYSNKEARKTAKRLLNRVGLQDKLHECAGNLSSGQKQRLSIARALAKNTDIIVADEPTGNLDSDTGKQIMELFSELKKDRLIIVVTHNYEEAAPFVTRKIRLHEGDIVSDEQTVRESEQNKTNVETKNTEQQTFHKRRSEQKLNSDRRIAASFAWMNITTQPRRVVFFMMLLLIASAVNFFFFGEIFSNWDDTFVKKYNDSAFSNSDTTRIVVKKADSSAMTDGDMKKFESVKYVRMADRYGFCNDINYYIKKGSDYDYSYSDGDEIIANSDDKTVQLLDESHFMKSSTCIHKEDLSTGSLPTGRYDVVLYSKNRKDIGKELKCYFTSQNIWGYSQYYYTTVKVTGILKKKTDQVFFSGELCNMLSAGLYGDSYKLNMCWNLFKSMYTENMAFIPVIGDNIEDKEGEAVKLSVSKNYILTGGGSALGQAQLELYRAGEEDGKADVKLNANIIDENELSSKFVEMSESLFYQLFTGKSRQASLYIRDYIDTDYVLKYLNSHGYIAISSYRISSVAYDNDKVIARNKMIVIAILVLLIMGIFELIIIKSIFRIKRQDYIVLKSMGMSWKTLRLMNLFEMLVYTAASVILIPVLAEIISRCGLKYLQNMVKYYNLFTYSVYVFFTLFVIAATVRSVDRYLKRKQKWS